MNTCGTRRLFWVVLLGAFVAVSWHLPQATAKDTSYSVKQTFSWTPGAGTIAMDTQVKWQHFEHAWADKDCAPGSGIPTSPDIDFHPAVQKPTFKGVGTDSMDNRGQVWNSGVGGPVRVNESTQIIAHADPPIGNSSTANAVDGNSNATANSAWHINQWGDETLAGWTKASGTTHAPSTSSAAYAFSESKLLVRVLTMGASTTGGISWGPEVVMNGSVSGSAMAVDPFVVSIYDDPNDPNLVDTPIHIWASLDLGASDSATLAWKDGNLSAIDVINGEFHGSVMSAYIDPNKQGTFDLVIADGNVTQSSGTGIFSGLLPSEGHSGNFTTSFLNGIDLDYDYPGVAGNISLEFGKAGEGHAIPEPATMSLLSLGGLAMIRRRRR